MIVWSAITSPMMIFYKASQKFLVSRPLTCQPKAEDEGKLERNVYS